MPVVISKDPADTIMLLLFSTEKSTCTSYDCSASFTFSSAPRSTLQ